ncbi:predicted protein [Chaetoceros tenuissimus]|uniref:Uncharacterized protein n=1 Tax=Chaetoceros tenuissimus TaxID=426638 RepID=A0AAD3D2Q9_9STRA|nr:predicted protein [Chaetoceros tenuissimus]
MVQSPTRARSIQSSNFGTILMVVLFSIAVIHSINKSLTSYNVYFKVAKDSSKSAVVTGDILADSKVNIDSVDMNIMTDKGHKSTIEDNEEEKDESDTDESKENLVEEEAAEKEEAQNDDDDDEDDGEKETKTTDYNVKMETAAGTESGEDTKNDTSAEEKDILMKSEVDEKDEIKKDDSIKDKGDIEEAEKENDEKDESDDGADIYKNTTAQDVTVLDEDVNNVEDDRGSTKEKASDGIPEDEKVVQVAPEDPVETSTEI